MEMTSAQHSVQESARPSVKAQALPSEQGSGLLMEQASAKSSGLVSGMPMEQETTVSEQQSHCSAQTSARESESTTSSAQESVPPSELE